MATALPTRSTDPSYAPAILDAVMKNNFDMPYAEIVSTYKGHTGKFLMSADALKIDGIRYGAGAYLMQQIADAIGCLFPTPKLRDLQWQQRNVDLLPVTIWGYLKPQTWSVVAERGHAFGLDDMTLVETMHFISSQIDGLIDRSGKSGIVQNTGKSWVLTNGLLSAPGHAANYGWYYRGACPTGQPCSNSPATPGLWMIQGPGTDWMRHDLSQGDYAQTVNLVHRHCQIDGKDADLADVYQDPELSGLVSHEGPLKLLRQPTVPCIACSNASANHVTSAMMLTDPQGTRVCPEPPPPINVESSFLGINWGMVAVTAGLAGATVAAFLLALRYAGHHVQPKRRGA